MMITLFLRPVMALSRAQQSTFLKQINQQKISPLNMRIMSTTSNYHYHQKPQEHGHDKLWKAERYLSLGLLGILPAASVISHPAMDHLVALSLVVHVHWGVEAIVTDYIRPSIFGPIIPKISVGIVYLLSSMALGGLFIFNYTDVGISQAVRMLAKI